MPLVIPPGFADIAIELRSTGDPDPWYVTFGMSVAGLSGDMAAIGTQANGAWGHAHTLVSNEVEHTGCKISVGQDAADPVRGFSALNASGNGGSSAAMLPQNCAALVHKDTGVGGRRAKGRFFVPNILVEGSVDNVGVITTTHFNQLQAAFDAMFLALETDTPGPTPMYVLHNSDGISPMIVPTEVLALRVDRVVSTQRKRLR